jgi:transcriptional regulator with XRE-family HTH domain
LRDALGFSQDELASKGQLLGWSATRGLIAKIESGERSVSDDELRHLAFLLDTTVDELIDWEKFKAKSARKLQDLNNSVNNV